MVISLISGRVNRRTRREHGNRGTESEERLQGGDGHRPPTAPGQ